MTEQILDIFLPGTLINGVDLKFILNNKNTLEFEGKMYSGNEVTDFIKKLTKDMFFVVMKNLTEGKSKIRHYMYVYTIKNNNLIRETGKIFDIYSDDNLKNGPKEI